MRVPFRVEAGEVADVAESHPAPRDGIETGPSRSDSQSAPISGCSCASRLASCLPAAHPSPAELARSRSGRAFRSSATFTVRELRDDELQEVSGGASTPGPDLSWASYATSGQAPTWFAWFLWQ